MNFRKQKEGVPEGTPSKEIYNYAIFCQYNSANREYYLPYFRRKIAVFLSLMKHPHFL